MHAHKHTNKSLDETPRTHSRDLIPSLSYLCVGKVQQRMIRREKRGEHKPSMKENVPFEVVFILETSFSITWLVKQIIKCNGWGGIVKLYL